MDEQNENVEETTAPKKTRPVMKVTYEDGTEEEFRGLRRPKNFVNFERLFGHSPTDSMEDNMRLSWLIAGSPGGAKGFEDWLDSIEDYNVDEVEVGKA